MNIAAYCRVSTDKEDQLNSLEKQKEFFSDYARRTGDNLVRLYADEGITGTRIKNRVEFLRMMKDAEKGKFEVLVVKDISRFARNTVDLLQNIRKLKGLGIKTQFLTANMSSMGDSEFVLTIFGALAQEESANTSKRVKFGKKVNAKKGKIPNIIYGYDKILGDYFNLKINEQEAQVIRRIYDMYIKEGIGAGRIAKCLNEENIKTKRGCKWSQAGICRILRNEIYIGKVVNNRSEVTDFLTGKRALHDQSEWIVVDNPALQIIDKEVFIEAQKIMHERGDAMIFNNKRPSTTHLFSQLIKCKDCGSSFRQIVKQYKNRYVRWVCANRNSNGVDVCPNNTIIDENELIEKLQNYFKSIIENRKNAKKFIIDQFEKVYKAENENIAYVNELKKKLNSLQKRRKKYMEMYADELVSREELNMEMLSLNKSVEKVEGELKFAVGSITRRGELDKMLNKTFADMENLVDVKNMNNMQLKKIISKIEVDHNGNVDIYLKLLGELGLDDTVLVYDNYTQGYD